MPPNRRAPGAIPVLLQAELNGLLAHHGVTLLTVAGPEAGEAEAVAQLRAAGVPVLAALRAQPSGWARWLWRWRVATRWLRGQWPWRSVWFWDPEVQRLINRALRDGAYDLVQIEDNAMGVYRYPTDAPKIFTEHEVRRPRRVVWRSPAPLSWPRWLAREADWQRWPGYQRRVWRKFDRLQVFTTRDAESMAKLAPEVASHIRVNPFGVELPALPDGAPSENGALLFVGNFTHPPNVEAVLWLGREIMPRLRTRRPDAHLTIVGIFPPPEVLALAGDRVEVMGPVPDIAPYFQRAALVVAPVRTGGGMRMKVLQAMAYAKPVVTTERGAMGLSVNGLRPPLVTSDDADGMAELVADLLADEGRRCALGQAARAYVAEYFSPQAYTARLEAIYAELQQ